MPISSHDGQTNKLMSIILASTSPYRQQLLQRLNLPFQCDKSPTDETPLPDESSLQLSRRLALSKAHNLAEQYPNHLLIGSDQSASLNGTFLHKPGSMNKAIEQLQYCSGKQVHFHTSVCLYDSKLGKYQLESDISRVVFRHLNLEEISTYLEIEQPFDCAGSFKCEGLGISLFSAIHNQDPTALMGLPLIALSQMLRQAGVQLYPQHT